MTNRFLSKIKPTYIFNFFAIILIIISIILGYIYNNTQKEIIKINHNANMEYVRSLSNNLKVDIKRIVQKDFAKELKEDAIAREYIESNLNLFVTTKYKYIYLIAKPDRESKEFVYLTKSAYSKKYSRFEKDNYLKSFTSKQALYFQNRDQNELWATYISPIIVKDKVEALLVIKFSLQERSTILLVLKSLGKLFKIVFGFLVFIFIFVLWFAVIDKKREKQKNTAFDKLQKSNAILNLTTNKLKIESQRIKDLNDNLEKRVKNEVDKNRIKDIQLIHQARLAQMGEMLSMIAHQWRQPLNAISATSTSLNLKTKLDKLEKEYVLKMTDNILEYTQHLSNTIDDFRNFFKPNKEKVETSYTEVVESVDKIVSISLTEKNITFIKNLECSSRFFSYPSELKQVVLNFVKNAEDTLLDKKQKDPRIVIRTYETDDSFVLEVRDNGGGISEDIIDKIFDPYFSTKLEKDGTGLGLYMSKTIIQEHCNGAIHVSNQGDGAMFKIILGKDNV